MSLKILLIKIKSKLWTLVIKRTKKFKIYPYLYISYWHYLIFNNREKYDSSSYLSAQINVGAGIGHQLANWIAGYWFAKQFKLNYAYISFPNKKWDDFFGFGENETYVEDLIKLNRYKKILLPLFDEYNHKEIVRTIKIINSYKDKKLIFLTEKDQFYHDQFGVMEDIKRKFYKAKFRQKEKLFYSKDFLNIAIHIRRGDIGNSNKNKNINLQMRWQNESYFINVLKNVVNTIRTIKPIAIFLFSQGDNKNFQNFNQFYNLTFCLNLSDQDSFVHMVYADILITSKSSFSYKPALLSNGIKLVPQNFWHGYPNSNDWIIVDDNGEFDYELLKTIKID